MNLVVHLSPESMHLAGIVVKLQIRAAIPIIRLSEKNAFTLRILSLIGYDISTATVSLILIRIKFLLYSLLSSGMRIEEP
jgi:hypothetical protein